MTLLDVVLFSKTKSLDRTFTYKVDNEMANKISIGSRVLVPFGKSNTPTIGVIININSKYLDLEILDSVKKIYLVIDDTSLITKNQIELAMWIKNEYLSTYIDALSLFLPPSDIKSIKLYYSINKKLNYIPSKDDIEIIRAFKSSDIIEASKLYKSFGKKVQKQLDKLTDDLALELKFIVYKNKNEKFVKFYSKSKDYTVEEGLKLLSKNANKQRDIWSSEWKKQEMSLNELITKFNTSSNAVNKLVEKKLLIESNKILSNKTIKSDITSYNKHVLNEEQKNAYDRIIKSDNNFFLLHGITGSGKTEVYLQLVEQMVKLNKGSIILVPEISLTPQTIERFVGRFGDRVAVLHSKLTASQRLDQWNKIKKNELDIVIGARSAIFAPINNLGMIIIDEEHENSYKSTIDPKYNTIDVAKKRCLLEGSKLVLGSATPSIESYHNAKNSAYELLEIKNRIEYASLPEIKVVDMREELNTGNMSIFSRSLYEGIISALKRKEQVILFLNKRGYSSFVSCRNCGYVIKCDSCDVSMTVHKQKNKLVCHYCGKTKKHPSICPNCGSDKFKQFGIGTEKLEELTKKVFPYARVKRADSDTVNQRDDYQNIYKAMKSNDIDILIGTQMISKGFDFPNVSLVGVVAADSTIFLPDYRSAERSFQLITQVSGRAGRGRVRGNVIVQTYNPDHYSIKYAKEYDYENFYNLEIKLRKEFQYPPFVDIILITIYGPSLNEVKSEMEEYYDEFIFILKNKQKNISMIGKPHIAPIEKINNNYRYQLIIKFDHSEKDELLKYVEWVFIINRNKKGYKCNKISIDIDPVSTL
ncbi:primosomal protein N' [Soehngenia longivitae]|uniref:Replication restart protein PriA n=1 Tax=Soehngenia longivitae TaxID=2562294 RepID=A0A4Z0D1E7_9FIRM|nr:primosomal protein N' [Soehngenia longivitae]TFZ39570.1 primosomal protein N' [Soehngenia longivitae]